jgi:hypothetical protein
VIRITQKRFDYIRDNLLVMPHPEFDKELLDLRRSHDIVELRQLEEKLWRATVVGFRGPVVSVYSDGEMTETKLIERLLSTYRMLNYVDRFNNLPKSLKGRANTGGGIAPGLDETA